MSNIEYLESLDFRLAKALGHNPIQYVSAEVGKRIDGVFIDWKLGAYPALNKYGKLFNPTRNWELLGPLMVEHGVYPKAPVGPLRIFNTMSRSKEVFEPIDPAAKPDPETEVRADVVLRLIQKLAPGT